MDFIDEYITQLIYRPQKYSLDPALVDEAEALANDASRIGQLQSTMNGAAALVEAEHVALICKYDMLADGMGRAERIVLLQSLSAERSLEEQMLQPPIEHKIALKRILESELALARGSPKSTETSSAALDALYHRTRAFAYTMVFFFSPRLLPLLLLSGAAGLAHTCDFALAAVILDDAEDAEEDRAADSTTLFTVLPRTDAVSLALEVIAHLSQKSYPAIDVLNAGLAAQGSVKLLEVKDFLLLALAKTREFAGAAPFRKGVDTRAFLRALATPKPKDAQAQASWRKPRS